MKKLVLILCIFLTTVFYPGSCYGCEKENSKEVIYRDMTLSLLMPYIQKEINKYYSDYLTEEPLVLPYSVDVINVVRPVDVGYLMRMEVIARPFIGPHYTVGDDRIVLETGAFGFIRIVEYQHLKTYELPWNWKHIVK